MHTMWKGVISFGLVNIPIKLYAATEDKTIRMRQLHNKCHHPIRYTKQCPACETEVEQADITKGVEYDSGQFVIMDKEELEAIESEKHKRMDIIDFVALNDIDPIYFNRSYYVGPNENGEKAFSLLQRAMEHTGKIGIGKFMIRSKEHLAAIRVYKNSLVLETIHYADEVRNVDHVPGLPETENVNEKELDMAVQLIEQLASEFDPDKYHDEYRERLQEMIDQKISGEEIKIAKEVPQTDIRNLMDALQASIEQNKKDDKKPKQTKSSSTAKPRSTKRPSTKQTARRKKASS